MRKTSAPNYLFFTVLYAFLTTILPLSAEAQTNTGPGTLVVDCAGDLKMHCSHVSPGGDRLVACLIAYEDKISPRCRLTAYVSSGNLGNRMKELQAMAKSCWSDISQYCSNVPSGGGRIYDCLKSHKATLTDDCRNEMPRFEPVLRD